jgi:hypothetical protein
VVKRVRDRKEEDIVAHAVGKNTGRFNNPDER